MTTSLILSCSIVFATLLLLGLFFFRPLRGLFLLILRSVFGWAGLYILNLAFAFSGFSIGVNLASASIVGILGLPGVVLLALLKFIGL